MWVAVSDAIIQRSSVTSKYPEFGGEPYVLRFRIPWSKLEAKSTGSQYPLAAVLVARLASPHATQSVYVKKPTISEPTEVTTTRYTFDVRLTDVVVYVRSTGKILKHIGNEVPQISRPPMSENVKRAISSADSTNNSSSVASATSMPEQPSEKEWTDLAEKYVRQVLKDPESVQFQFWTVRHEDGLKYPVVCGQATGETLTGLKSGASYSGFKRFVADPNTKKILIRDPYDKYFLQNLNADFESEWMRYCDD
jgi:hypothetical protein